MKITRIAIIHSRDADVVVLETDLPSPVPNLSLQNLTLRFDVAQHGGEEYVQKYFSQDCSNIVVTEWEESRFGE